MTPQNSGDVSAFLSTAYTARTLRALRMLVDAEADIIRFVVSSHDSQTIQLRRSTSWGRTL